MRRIKILPSNPIFAYIELTFDCNNHCLGCGNVSIDDVRPTDLHLEQWEKIFRKIKPAVAHLCLTGGEPTLHPHFEETIFLVDKFEFSFSIFTNARWHDPDDVVGLLKGSQGLAEVLVSMHGPDPKSHEAFTGVSGSFSDAYRNIRRAVVADIPIAISTIITRLNFDRLDEMLRLGQELGAASITFSRYVNSYDDDLTPTNDQLILAMEEILKRFNNTLLPIFTSVCIPRCFHPSPLFNACYAGTTSITIDPSGNVRPCAMAPLLCGNLLEESLAKIWHGDMLEYWRNSIPSTCTNCSAVAECRGGCRAAAVIRGLENDPLQCQPLSGEEGDSQEEITLPETASPIGRFVMRPEPFGFVLISGPRVVPVTKDAITVLQVCDGKITLKQIYEGFGQSGLDLVASLCKQGMMELNF